MYLIHISHSLIVVILSLYFSVSELLFLKIFLKFQFEIFIIFMLHALTRVTKRDRFVQHLSVCPLVHSYSVKK